MLEGARVSIREPKELGPSPHLWQDPPRSEIAGRIVYLRPFDGVEGQELLLLTFVIPSGEDGPDADFAICYLAVPRDPEAFREFVAEAARQVGVEL